MRLLATEHKKILEVLNDLGLAENTTLVKRKGWVYIETDNGTFSFHRKKKSVLVDQHFVNEFQYYTKVDNQIVEMPSFNAVLASMKKALKAMS